ncbi:MAG: hypothetical protein M2R45_00741 [Verrucomicrobia subdivision 3 bacterium]|nr:hypothetical protein [Limisphaerales bacterium]MCS1413152.1 hypothetical protein [Limisphaerales bacterium]
MPADQRLPFLDRGTRIQELRANEHRHPSASSLDLADQPCQYFGRGRRPQIPNPPGGASTSQHRLTTAGWRVRAFSWASPRSPGQGYSPVNNSASRVENMSSRLKTLSALPLPKPTPSTGRRRIPRELLATIMTGHKTRTYVVDYNQQVELKNHQSSERFRSPRQAAPTPDRRIQSPRKINRHCNHHTRSCHIGLLLRAFAKSAMGQ